MIPQYPRKYSITIPHFIEDEITALQALWAILDLPIYHIQIKMIDFVETDEVNPPYAYAGEYPDDENDEGYDDDDDEDEDEYEKPRELKTYPRLVVDNKNNIDFETVLFTWAVHPGIIVIDFFADKQERIKITTSLLPNCYPSLTIYDLAGDIFVQKQFIPLWEHHLQTIFN